MICHVENILFNDYQISAIDIRTLSAPWTSWFHRLPQKSDTDVDFRSAFCVTTFVFLPKSNVTTIAAPLVPIWRFNCVISEDNKCNVLFRILSLVICRGTKATHMPRRSCWLNAAVQILTGLLQMVHSYIFLLWNILSPVWAFVPRNPLGDQVSFEVDFTALLSLELNSSSIMDE